MRPNEAYVSLHIRDPEEISCLQHGYEGHTYVMLGPLLMIHMTEAVRARLIAVLNEEPVG